MRRINGFDCHFIWESYMATSRSNGSFPLTASAHQTTQRAGRLKVLAGQGTTVPRGKGKGRKASISWVVAASLLGFAMSYLLGAEVSPLMSPEKTQRSAGERVSVVSSTPPAATKYSISTRPAATWRNRLRLSDWATYYDLFMNEPRQKTSEMQVGEPSPMSEQSGDRGSEMSPSSNADYQPGDDDEGRFPRSQT